jgi:hypothetical protein
MINPAKLAPEKRDSVCAQCHLSGEVRVTRAGASWDSYRPGDRLADSTAVFVRADVSPGMRVTSHFEKLAQSACKRTAGDRLWCGSCHDPHSVPSAANRAAWFRAKCRSCHAADACRETAANRAKRQDDCAACHMPKSTVTDAEHVVYTDHSIPRRPRAAAVVPPAEAKLIPFGGAAASPRDVALAYAIVATRPGAAGRTARDSLGGGAERRTTPSARLPAEITEIPIGRIARSLYRRAMQLDPAQVTASSRPRHCSSGETIRPSGCGRTRSEEPDWCGTPGDAQWRAANSGRRKPLRKVID